MDPGVYRNDAGAPGSIMIAATRAYYLELERNRRADIRAETSTSDVEAETPSPMVDISSRSAQRSQRSSSRRPGR